MEGGGGPMARRLLSRVRGSRPMAGLNRWMVAGRNVYVGGVCLVLLLALVVVQSVLGKAAGEQTNAADQVPIYQVDPLWPKPLPNDWIVGAVIGVSVDAQDRVWMLHRP